MAERDGGFSGAAVAVLTVGGLLVYFGINNIPVLEGLREFLRGDPPKRRPTTPTPVPLELNPLVEAITRTGGGLSTDGSGMTGGGGSTDGSASGSAIVTAARRYLGVPYVWGGHSASGMDCSGLVTVALKEAGVTNLPSMTHTVSQQFYVWNAGSTIVKREDIQPGDLVCWTGHIGIAVDKTNMIHAPTFGESVKIGPIWWVPAPIIRRVKMQASSSGGGNRAV